MNKWIKRIKKKLPKKVKICLRFVADFCFLIIGVVYFFVLNLRKKTRVARLNAERIGHFVLDVESFLRRGYDRKEYRIIFLLKTPICNSFLFYKWSQILEIVSFQESVFFGNIIHSLLKYNFYTATIDHSGGEYFEWNFCNPVFSFTQEEKEIGDKTLERMGISKEDWYVCVFARDSAYLKNYPYRIEQFKDNGEHDYRDSDINSLEKSMRYIIDRGGWVIRLGQIVENRMNFKHPKIIDYPFSQWRSDFMDIYLQFRAKFVLSSSTSGITDVVALFNTPYCGVNMPFYYNTPYKNSISIPKKMQRNGIFLSLPQVIILANSVSEDKIPPNYPDFFRGDFYTKNHIEFIANTQDEILELTIEMFERLEGVFVETQEEWRLQQEYMNTFRLFDYFSSNQNPIGKRFLNENAIWFLGDRQ